MLVREVRISLLTAERVMIGVFTLQTYVYMRLVLAGHIGLTRIMEVVEDVGGRLSVVGATGTPQ
jgi:hypothetical protein